MILSALLAVLLIPGRAAAQDAGRWDARLTSVKGEVTVQPADGSETAPARTDMPLEQGDTIVTGAGSSAEVALDGGSLIDVAENSTFELESLEKSDSRFSLSLGSLLAKIQSLGERRLSVRTPTTVAAVRGTEFGVDVESAEQSHVGVFDEGRVEVTGSGATEVLTANQETSVARGRPPLKAFALKRFVARRKAMRAQLKRLKAVGKRWKAMSGDKRRELRRGLFLRGQRGMRGQRGQRGPRDPDGQPQNDDRRRPGGRR